MRLLRRGSTGAAARHGLLALALVAPAAAYFAFISIYGVNTIVADQWADVGLLQKVYSGHGTLAAFWAPHNENRTLVPNLAVVALAHLSHFNTLAECYLNAVLLYGAALLIVYAHRRRAPRVSLWWYAPVPVALMTLAQFSSTLLGYQLSWYLALFAIVASMLLLDGPGLGWWQLSLAVAAAVVGSFSSFEGLLAWAGGLVLLLLRRRRVGMTAVWLAAAGVTSSLYFYHLGLGSHLAVQYALDSPLAAARFFFVALGDVIGYGLPLTGASATTESLLTALGIAVTGVAAFSFVRGATATRRDTAAPLGCALIAVGLLFAIFIAGGRALFGLAAASGSRYVTFDVLPIVGSYLVWLSPSPTSAPDAPRLWRHSRGGVALVVASTLVLASFGAYHGFEGGRFTRTFDRDASDVLVNISVAPDWLIEGDVYPLVSPEVVRELAPVARRQKLSLFDTSQVSVYKRRGLDVGLSYPLYLSG